MIGEVVYGGVVGGQVAGGVWGCAVVEEGLWARCRVRGLCRHQRATLSIWPPASEGARGSADVSYTPPGEGGGQMVASGGRGRG